MSSGEKVEKLDDCEVCGKNKAKYTCPKCEVRSCCLTCSNIHKKELECDGIRDKTKFLPAKSITEMDLMSDYCLLQEVGRCVDKYNRDPLKHCTTLNNFLPIYLRKLKSAAFRRGINLEFMPRSFSRNKENTTRYIWKKNELLWRIDWIFPQAENIKWSTEKASENARLSVLLENVLDPDVKKGEDPDQVNVKSILRNKLQFYRSAGINGIKVLMKAEKIQNSNSKFYELDPCLTLSENLEHKTIIEYPILYVILSHTLDMYEIIDSDDEAEKEVHKINSQHRHKFKPNHQNFGKSSNDTLKQNNSIQTPEGEANQINFLFHTEFSDSEDEKTKVEKDKNVQVQKKRKPRKYQKEQIQKKTLKISDSINEFTGICKSDSEDEVSKLKISEIEIPQDKSLKSMTINERIHEIQKPLRNFNAHITDSEGEGPEEIAIQRLEANENGVQNEKNNQNESTPENKNNVEKDSKAIQSIAMNYFGAYMSDSEEETTAENITTSGNSGLHIPDYNDLVQMKH